jgi:uncharacterized protein (DUF1697 family)
MTSVVLLRGVNVGGHRTFRPSVLARQLRRYDLVNVGAAGTFVVRRSVSTTKLRAELAGRLPYETHVMICSGSDLLRLAWSNPFTGQRSAPNVVPFVSVLARVRRPSTPLPLRFPATGAWGMRILGQQGRFVFGLYRRTMRAITHLEQVDRIFGAPATTRNWNTIMAVAHLLEASQRALDRT